MGTNFIFLIGLGREKEDSGTFVPKRILNSIRREYNKLNLEPYRKADDSEEAAS